MERLRDEATVISHPRTLTCKYNRRDYRKECQGLTFLFSVDYRTARLGEPPLNRVVFRSFPFEKLNRAFQFIQPVHAVLDRDPTGETGTGQDAKDRVIIVQPLTRLAVTQLVGIAEASVGLAEIVERGARSEIAIRGVHRHDAIFYFLQKTHWIEAAHSGIGRIVLHSEMR